MFRASWVPSLLLLAFVASACGDDDAAKTGNASAGAGGSSPSPSAGSGGAIGNAAGSGAASAKGGSAGEVGVAGNAAAAGKSGAAGGSAGAPIGGGAGAAGAAAEAVDEVEPNGGATLTEVNAIVVGTPTNGAIGAASDADVFRLEAVPGKVYVVRLTRPAGSKLSPHLAVFDAGRGKKAPGDDYTKIGLATGPNDDAVVEILAMGEGGYFIGVRDERNVDDPKKALGDAAYTYQLDVTELAPSARVEGPLPLPGKVQGTFAFAGALHLFSFEAGEGQELTADFVPDAKGIDGRFFVYSATTQDWAARNDNRSETNPSPLFDAVPVQPAGPAYLVVENIDPSATGLGYAVTSK